MQIEPLQEEDISLAIAETVEGADIQMKLNGANIELIVVSDAFEGLSTLKRQQKVLTPLSGFIQNGSLHAVSMKTFTVVEWDKQKFFCSF